MGNKHLGPKTAILLSLLASAGCGAERQEPYGAFGSEDESGIDSLEGGTARLDVGGRGSEEGCDKVDFLFVIDNSGSMEDEQKNLINSFPGFISTIRDTLRAQDYHLMVIDTDAGGHDAYCAQVCLVFDECNGTPCDELEAAAGCDGTLGGGKVLDKFQNACAVADGRRYITDGQPDLEETFACIAEVGTNGSGDEQQNEALLAAISPEMVASSACNEGFLRDDALLVVTIISDEEDGAAGPDADQETGSTTPEQWVAQLVARKGGDANALVLLGLVGDTDLDDAICRPLDANFGSGAEPSPRLRQFIQSFPNHVLGSVCSPDYAPFFETAVGVIDTACEAYVPVG